MTALTGTRILLAEDNTATQRMYSRALERDGHRVSTAGSLEEARGLIAAGDYDLIIVDLVLDTPQAGSQLLAEIKNNPASSRIPVMTMTGQVDSFEELRRTSKTGAAECLTKPISLEALRAKVWTILSRSRRSGKNGKPARSQPLAEKRILIIDDDPAIQELVRFALERRYRWLWSCERGKDGFEQAAILIPDLILLDVTMPDRNGVDVYNLLKGDKRTRDIPVLIMTGMEDEVGAFKTAIISLGANDFLRKPFGENELIHHVEMLLNRKRPAPKRTREPKPDLTLRKGPVKLDPRSRRVWVSDKQVPGLTTQDFDLLTRLLNESPGIVGWRKLSRTLGGPPGLTRHKAQNAVRTAISRLKKHLPRAAAACIVTP